jgi:dGTPase
MSPDFTPPPRAQAAYAVKAEETAGRLVPEPSSPTRSPFQRDRDRILHSTAFRRLAHKTQVFVPHEGDHYRTRLTHTLEVAQIARALARALGLDDDLAEALALAHDLGHTPFGHTGEDALEEAMAQWSGFDHNGHALRIVTQLERRYASFDGLNLTWESLEGLVKHNGPLTSADGTPLGHYAKRGLPQDIGDYNARHPLFLHLYASAEAQCAALADDIAYNAHDIDDGLRAGLFDLGDLRQCAYVGDLVREVERLYPALERPRYINELSRRLITGFVEDAISQSQARLRQSQVKHAQEVREQGRAMIAFSPPFAEADRAIKAYLYPHMYRHERVMRVRLAAGEVVKRLYKAFIDDPLKMPSEWARQAQAVMAGQEAERQMAFLVRDYIAGMTDRYALNEHRRLFDEAPDLR